MKHPVRVAAALVGLLSLAGCATTKYQCPTPSGVACMSAKDVYALTDAPGKEGMQAAEAAYADTSSHHRKKADPGTARISAPASAAVPLPKPGDVVPIREQSRVMRIWIAPYEDTQGNLVMATRIYTDMESRRWSVGEPAAEESHHFFPMQVDPSAPAPAPAAVQPGAQTAVPGTDTPPSS